MSYIDTVYSLFMFSCRKWNSRWVLSRWRLRGRLWVTWRTRCPALTKQYWWRGRNWTQTWQALSRSLLSRWGEADGKSSKLVFLTSFASPSHRRPKVSHGLLPSRFGSWRCCLPSWPSSWRRYWCALRTPCLASVWRTWAPKSPCGSLRHLHRRVSRRSLVCLKWLLCNECNSCPPWRLQQYYGPQFPCVLIYYCTWIFHDRLPSFCP